MLSSSYAWSSVYAGLTPSGQLDSRRPDFQTISSSWWSAYLTDFSPFHRFSDFWEFVRMNSGWYVQTLKCHDVLQACSY